MERVVVQEESEESNQTIKGNKADMKWVELHFIVIVCQEQCSWKSDQPTILSVCLISLEPDNVLRLMHDQFTPGNTDNSQIIVTFLTK